jgi:multicomponent Na+:H+ antiporter subunit B
VKDLVVLRVVARWNIPFMVVFGLYVQTHGELGPGGGFQAGVIIAAGFILYGMIFGAAAMRRIVPRWVSDLAAAGGVLLYAGVGVYSMLLGYEFLDHTAINPANPGAGEPWGMVLVEYGVGFTVAAVMLTIFNEITEGTTPDDDGEVLTMKEPDE